MNGSEGDFGAVLTNLSGSGLKEIPSASQSARFYRGADSLGKPYVIKAFDGIGLFGLELVALRSLCSTQRVCEVLYDSTRVEAKSGVASSKGPYCIVKPFYDRLLTGEKNPIVLLERCAQEADISARFWEYRWRDLDGRFDNDAVTADGRVIRFDLDGCSSYGFFEPKYTEQFHRAEETVLRQKIHGEVRERLFTEEAEIDSLIFRISRLLLRQFPNAWPALDAVAQSRAVAEASTRRKDGPRTIGALAEVLVGPFRGKTRTGLFKGPSQRGLDRWLEEWSQGFPATQTAGDWSTLSRDEAVAVGALCYEILHTRDHGFHLQDIRASFLVVCASVVLRRFKALSDARQPIEGLAALTQQMPELKTVARSVGPSEPPAVVAQPSTQTKTYHLECVYAGGAWKAVKKGSDRQVEDFVVGRAARPWIFLLADGVSGGNGSEAISILQSAVQPWLESYRPTSRTAAFEQLDRFISQVHSRLLAAAADGACQTTLLLTFIVESLNSAPVLVVVRYGNSGFIVTHEPQGQGGESVIARSRFTVPSGFLGSTKFDLKADQRTWEVRLEVPGTYRIRAISDGVAEGDERAEALVRAHGDIVRLVERAAEWPRETTAVGHDDWSVAGFDVQVEVRTDGTSPTVDEAAADPRQPADAGFLGELAKVSVRDFGLSDAAQAFWAGLVTSSDPRFRAVRDYPLIAGLASGIQQQSTVETPVEAFAEQTTSPEQPLAERAPRRSHLPTRRVTVFAAFVILLILGLRWLSVELQTTHNATTNETNVGQGHKPAQPPPPSFVRAEQASIYSDLLNHKSIVLSGAPKGSAIDQPPLAAFLADLAEVLKTADFSVLIEVHTDSHIKKGTPEQAAVFNQEISTKRANAIVSHLKQAPGLEDKKIEAIGKGSSVPLVPETTDADRDRNRRIVVGRTN